MATEEETPTPSPEAAAPAEAVPEVKQPSDTEALPEYEELTPELVEDECLRGDVMLRWGALLLAVLLSYTFITETQVLIEIRSGEYLASHGILPPRVDPFSTAAEGRPWINLGWLSDLLVGMAHRGGLGAVTLLGVATAVLAFVFLNKTNTSGVTTWWGSICAGICAVALFPQLQPGTMAITIAGLAILLWLIQRWRENPSANAVWQLPVLFLVWGNMDPHAFLGLIVLIAFGLGTLLTGAPERKVESSASGLRELWMQTGLSVIALMIHPWHWHTLQSGWVQLKIVPEEIRAYGHISEFLPDAGISYLSREYWQNVNPFDLATILLATLAFAMQVLNIVRFDGGLCLAWIAALACGAASSAVFTYTAVVSAVVASLAGQEWYRANFSMSYTVKTLPILYSRLGRAATVLAGFAIAYLAVNGSLMGSAGRRLGMGLDPRWEKRIASLEKTSAEGAIDDRPFPFRPDQGDLMLWLGQKPFIDSRLSLFAAGGDNLLQLHRDMRQALLGVDSRTGRGLEPLKPFEVLDKYQITHAVTRLWAPNPPYDVFIGLLNRQDDWVLTGLGAAGATFTRANTGRAEVDKFVEEHNAMRFVDKAFRSGAESVSASRFDVPKPVGDYDRWLYQPLPELTADVELATHYLRLALEASRGGNPQQTTALAVLASRHARRGLIKNANQAEGWRILSQAQAVLLSIELQLAQQVPPTMLMRNQATLAATANAVRAGHENPSDLEQFLSLQLEARRLDISLAIMKRLETVLGGRLTRLPPTDPNAEEAEKNQRELLQQLEEAVEKARDSVAEAAAQNKEQTELVSMAIQAGCPVLAVETFEKDLTSISSNISASLLYGSLLLEVGRTDDGWQFLEGLERILPQPPVPLQAASIMQEWYRVTSLANYAVGNLDRAEELLRQSGELRNMTSLSGLVQQPFAVTMTPTEQIAWPMIMTRMMASSAAEFPEFQATQLYQQALIKIDTGNVQESTKLLKEILDVHPNWSNRILVVYYLTLLTGEEFSVDPPSDEIPITPDLFAPEEPETPAEAESSTSNGNTPATEKTPVDGENAGKSPPPEGTPEAGKPSSPAGSDSPAPSPVPLKND